MKNPVLISALAAGLAAAAPSTAGAAAPATGARQSDGPVLAEHRRDCLGWAGVNRALHQRYHRVRLRRSVRNRRGEKIYIVHVKNFRGRYYRVRVNACTQRITGKKRLRHVFCRKGRRLRSCLGRATKTRPERRRRR
ncbi:MAG: hypothetical protein ACLFWF_07720 [Alphaproteobacteria bacterium]